MTLEVAVAIVGIFVSIIFGLPALLEYRQRRQEAKRAVAGDAAEEHSFETPLSKADAIPNNLPARRQFFGRTAEIARIHDALISRSPITVIEGIGGIGKTSLALEIAHDCLRDSHNDVEGATPKLIVSGVIWASARDRELNVIGLLDTVARTIGYTGIAQQPLETKLPNVLELLRSRSYLLVIDNFETITDEAIHDFLRQFPEPSRVLITSRPPSFSPATIVPLGELPKIEGVELIRYEMGLTLASKATDEQILELYRATGGSPLAIKWSVGQIRQKGQSLNTVLAYLVDARGDIYPEIFDRSWYLLTNDARTTLMAATLFVSPPLRKAIEAVTDIHGEALDEPLAQNVSLSLIEATTDIDESTRRYSIHPLTRAYASRHLHQELDLEASFRQRTNAFYKAACESHSDWGTTRHFRWLDAEMPNILSTLDSAYNQSELEVVISICRSITYFLGTKGYWQERLHYHEMALECAKMAGDVDAQAYFHFTRGWVLHAQMESVTAKSEILQSVKLAVQASDFELAMHASNTLAAIAIATKDLPGAESALAAARNYARLAEMPGMPSSYLSKESQLAFLKGDMQRAEALMQQALKQSLESEVEGGTRLNALGKIKLALGEVEDAEVLFLRGLNKGEEYERTDTIAHSYLGLAKVAASRDDKDLARRRAYEAREQFIKLDARTLIGEVDELLNKLEM